MIFPFLIPYLMGFRSILRAPMTWALVAVNLLVFVSGHKIAVKKAEKIQQVFNSESLMDSQAELYADFILTYPDSYDADSIKLAKQVNEGNAFATMLLSRNALQDYVFFNRGADHYSYRDKVTLKWWDQKQQSYRRAQSEHPSSILGVQGGDLNLLTWVTYQFTHTEWWHFLMNMVFLVFFGAFLERVVGPLVLLILYLGTGFVGAGLFLAYTGPTVSPLIGASGSISGIMGFLCVYMWGRPIRYIYWLMMPVRGYAGTVYLPAWVAFISWIITDLSGLIESFGLNNQVSFICHIGGEFSGAFVALCLVAYKRYKSGAPLKRPTVPWISRNQPL